MLRLNPILPVAAAVLLLSGCDRKPASDVRTMPAKPYVSRQYVPPELKGRLYSNRLADTIRHKLGVGGPAVVAMPSHPVYADRFSPRLRAYRMLMAKRGEDIVYHAKPRASREEIFQKVAEEQAAAQTASRHPAAKGKPSTTAAPKKARISPAT